jgi:hypothetical protein
MDSYYSIPTHNNMDCEDWRLTTVKSQSQELKDALGIWQGSNGIMRATISTIKTLPNGQAVIYELKHDDKTLKKIKKLFFGNEILIIVHALQNAPKLPFGSVLYRVAVEFNNKDLPWMSTSTNLEGCISLLKKRKNAKLFKLIINRNDLPGLAVSTDDSYNVEKEILITTTRTFDNPTCTEHINGYVVHVVVIQ